MAGFFGVGFDELDDAFDKRVRKAFGERRLSPREVFLHLGAAFGFDGFGEGDEPLGGVGAAVEKDVFDEFERFLRDFFVNVELPRVDDAHVEAGTDCVI